MQSFGGQKFRNLFDGKHTIVNDVLVMANPHVVEGAQVFFELIGYHRFTRPKINLPMYH
jgi:hypothetical protein